MLRLLLAITAVVSFAVGYITYEQPPIYLLETASGLDVVAPQHMKPQSI